MGTSADDPAPDEFDRRLWQIASGSAADAAFKEPSAAERARRPVQPAGARRMSWRNARKAARLRKPVREPSKSRATGRRKGARTTVRARSARRRTRSLLTVVAVLGVLAGTGYALSRLGLSPSSPDHGAIGYRQSIRSPAFTISDPFAGSPAEHFAAGPAGIVPPAPRAVGKYSAAQVAAAYATTKRLLIAGDLDPQTLSGGRPDAFAQLLVPQQRSDFLDRLDKVGADKHGHTLSTRTWIASFAPGTTALVGRVIKVRGAMAATTAVDGGRLVLRITFDYLFVYPVQRPGQPFTRTRIVVRNRGDVDFAPWNDQGGSLQPWLQDTQSDYAGARCDIYDGFIHPEFPADQPDRVHPSGAPVDPYNLSQAPPPSGCEAITGT
jgi:hypothetical protein